MAKSRTPAPYAVEEDLIVSEGPVILPDSCVRCGAPAEHGKRTETTLAWAPPWVVLLIFCNLLILLIVYFVVRKQVFVGYSQCRDCRNRQLVWIRTAIIAWIGVIAFVALTISMEDPAPAIGAGIAFLVAIVGSVKGAGPVQVKKFENPDFLLKGFSLEFIEVIDERGASHSWECPECGEPLDGVSSQCPLCGAAVGSA